MSIPKGQYWTQRLQRLHSVEAISEAFLINAGETLPFFAKITDIVRFTLAEGVSLGSLFVERYMWQASEQSPQWTHVST